MPLFYFWICVQIANSTPQNQKWALLTQAIFFINKVSTYYVVTCYLPLFFCLTDWLFINYNYNIQFLTFLHLAFRVWFISTIFEMEAGGTANYFNKISS